MLKFAGMIVHGWDKLWRILGLFSQGDLTGFLWSHIGKEMLQQINSLSRIKAVQMTGGSYMDGRGTT